MARLVLTQITTGWLRSDCECQGVEDIMRTSGGGVVSDGNIRGRRSRTHYPFVFYDYKPGDYKHGHHPRDKQIRTPSVPPLSPHAPFSLPSSLSPSPQSQHITRQPFGCHQLRTIPQGLWVSWPNRVIRRIRI